jgi:hypothetical protein
VTALSHAALAGGTELVEQVVVVVGISMIALFVLSMLLLFVFTRLPRERQLRIAAASTHLEHGMRLALDRYVGAFAVIVAVAAIGLICLSVLIVLVRNTH